MYRLAVKRDFIAQHYLIGGDYGAENEHHSHHYALEVQLTGPTLNEQGYLLDIVEVEESLDQVIDIYRDATLNELPEFSGLNPSLEHFARILYERLTGSIDTGSLESVLVKLWEDRDTYVEYQDSF